MTSFVADVYCTVVSHNHGIALTPLELLSVCLDAEHDTRIGIPRFYDNQLT